MTTNTAFKMPFLNQLRFAIVLLTLGWLSACTSNQEEPIPDCSVSGLMLTAGSKTDTSCGASDGSVSLNATGGEAPYQFSVNGSARQESPQFENLDAGNFEFTVFDANDCSATLSVTIGSAGGVVISALSLAESGCKEENGSITVEATEGTPPYTYSIDNGEFQSENVFEGLSSGEHSIVVKDSEDCEFSETTQILSGVSFSEQISPIISNNCALSTCHGGSQSPDLRTFDAIKTNASSIKTRTGNRSMPLGSSLPQAEIDLIACWVDDGALDN